MPEQLAHRSLMLGSRLGPKLKNHENLYFWSASALKTRIWSRRSLRQGAMLKIFYDFPGTTPEIFFEHCLVGNFGKIKNARMRNSVCDGHPLLNTLVCCFCYCLNCFVLVSFICGNVWMCFVFHSSSLCFVSLCRFFSILFRWFIFSCFVSLCCF